MKTDIGSESRFLPTPPAFEGGGVPIRIFPRRLVWKNYNGLATRWRKIFEDFICFDRIHERDRQTDRHTQTDRHCMMT